MGASAIPLQVSGAYYFDAESRVTPTLLERAFSYYQSFSSAVSLISEGISYLERFKPLPSIYKKVLAVTRCIDLLYLYESGRRAATSLRAREIEPIILVEELTTEMLASLQTIVDAIDSLNFIGLPIREVAALARKLFPYTFIFEAVQIPRDVISLYKVTLLFLELHSASFNSEAFLERHRRSDAALCKLLDLSMTAEIKERTERAYLACLACKKDGLAPEVPLIDFLKARVKQQLAFQALDLATKTTYVVCSIILLGKKTALVEIISSSAGVLDTISYFSQRILLRPNPFSPYDRWEVHLLHYLVTGTHNQIKNVHALAKKTAKTLKTTSFNTACFAMRYYQSRRLPYQMAVG